MQTKASFGTNKKRNFASPLFFGLLFVSSTRNEESLFRSNLYKRRNSVDKIKASIKHPHGEGLDKQKRQHCLLNLNIIAILRFNPAQQKRSAHGKQRVNICLLGKMRNKVVRFVCVAVYRGQLTLQADGGAHIVQACNA